jgi:DNA-directed RNA polymerase subunit RPC12/RpoP
MKQTVEPFVSPQGNVLPGFSTEHVCSNCGYDLTQEELAAATCSDCGEPLVVKQSVSIFIADISSTGNTGE